MTAGETPDPALLAPDTDAENAVRVAKRRVWAVDQLKAELERGNDEVLRWLSQLREDDRDQRPDGLGMTLGKFVRIVQEERAHQPSASAIVHHDLIHLEQLRRSRETYEA